MEHDRTENLTRASLDSRAAAGARPAAPGGFDPYGAAETPADVYARRMNARYERQLAEKQRKRARVRNLLVALVALVAVALVGAFIYVNIINAHIGKGIDPELRAVLAETDLVNEPFYMVLMGTDESLDRDESGVTEGTYRTDSMMLARVDAPAQKVTLISIPRDTQVDLGTYGTHKANAAYAFGGPALAVQMVADLAGVPISHFMLIDMDGLCSVVDDLGGVEVDVPMEIDDEEYTGHLDAGLQTLSGTQALILARSRHAYDNYGDADGDAYRAANQRLVLTAIAKKILSSDIITLTTTVEHLSEYVQTDLTVADIVGLAQAFQGMDTASSLYSAKVPTDAQLIDDAWYDIVLDDEWRAMMDRVKAGLPPTEGSVVDSDTGTILAAAGDDVDAAMREQVSKDFEITVRNGTAVDGLGDQVATALEAQGYDVVDVGDADSTGYESTLVIYEDGKYARAAQFVAEAIGHGATAMPNDDTYVLHTDMLVVIGADYS